MTISAVARAESETVIALPIPMEEALRRQFTDFAIDVVILCCPIIAVDIDENSLFVVRDCCR